MKRVTFKELESILFSTELKKGMPTFASVVQLTDARLKKTGNPYKNVMKLSKVSIILNSEYEKAVINQLKREDKSEDNYEKGINTMPLVFGDKNCFAGIFKGELVIQYRPNDNVYPKTKYVSEGKIVDKVKIENFIPKRVEATNQGTEREIQWRKLYVKNIRQITLNGETYKVIQD